MSRIALIAAAMFLFPACGKLSNKMRTPPASEQVPTDGPKIQDGPTEDIVPGEKPVDQAADTQPTAEPSTDIPTVKKPGSELFGSWSTGCINSGESSIETTHVFAGDSSWAYIVTVYADAFCGAALESKTVNGTFVTGEVLGSGSTQLDISITGSETAERWYLTFKLDSGNLLISKSCSQSSIEDINDAYCHAYPEPIGFSAEKRAIDLQAQAFIRQ